MSISHYVTLSLCHSLSLSLSIYFFALTHILIYSLNLSLSLYIVVFPKLQDMNISINYMTESLWWQIHNADPAKRLNKQQFLDKVQHVQELWSISIKLVYSKKKLYKKEFFEEQSEGRSSGV